jgi:hypothetical protein
MGRHNIGIRFGTVSDNAWEWRPVAYNPGQAASRTPLLCQALVLSWFNESCGIECTAILWQPA